MVERQETEAGLLAVRLLAEPMTPIPSPLPCEPLPLLIALHQHVTVAMLRDIPLARLAAERARQVAALFPDEPLVQAQAAWSSGSAIFHLPDYQQALDHFDAALRWYATAEARYAPGQPPRDVRVVQVMRVACLSELGRYHEAQEAESLAMAWLSTNAHPAAELILLLNRSQLAGMMGDYPLMRALAIETVTLAETLDDPGRVAQGWINRAYACILLGRFVEAEEALDAADTWARTDDDPITAARALCNRAWLWRCKGELFAALRMLGQARAGLSEAINEEATLALEEALIFQQLNQRPEALRSAWRAAQLYARLAMPSYSADAALFAARIAANLRQEQRAQAMLSHARQQVSRLLSPLWAAMIDLAHTIITVDLGGPLSARARRQLRAQLAAAREVVQAAGLTVETAEADLAMARLDAEAGRRDAALPTLNALTDHPSPTITIAAHAALGRLLPGAAGLPYLRRAVDLSVTRRRTLPVEELQARYGGEVLEHALQLADRLAEAEDWAGALEVVGAAKAGPLLDLRVAAARLDPSAQEAINTARQEVVQLREQLHDHARKHLDAVAAGQTERAAFHFEQSRSHEQALRACEQRLASDLRLMGERGGWPSRPRSPPSRPPSPPIRLPWSLPASMMSWLACLRVPTPRPSSNASAPTASCAASSISGILFATG